MSASNLSKELPEPPSSDQESSGDRVGLEGLVKTAGMTGGSAMFAQVAGYVMVLLLTLSLGAGGFGLFALATTVKGIAVLVGSLSLGVTTVRFTAWYRGRQNLAGLQQLISATTWGTLIWSTLVAIGLGLLAPALAGGIFGKPAMATVLRVIAWTIPLDALFSVWISGLHGLGLTTRRAYLEQIVLPVARLVAVFGSFLLGHSVEGTLWMLNVASAVAMLAAGWLLGRRIPFWKISPFPLTDWREWAKYTVPSFLDALLVTSLGGSLEVLLLGIFASETTVGIYSVVLRLKFIIKMPMTAFNDALAPLISEAHSQNDRRRLEFLFRSATRWVIVIGMPLALAFILFGPTILSIFGAEFQVGYTALVIVTAGGMVNLMVGPVGHMLLMTGYSRVRLINSAILLFIQLILGVTLIPRWQIAGAATVAAVSVAVVSVLGLLEVFFLLNVHPYRRNLFKPILVCGLAAAAVMVAQVLLLPETLWPQILLAVFFCLGYCILLLKFGVDDEDRHMVSHWTERLRMARRCVTRQEASGGR
jgi:O-antigen/teichoic acid export membrane protein